ncbi:MAG: hypothetical protein V7K98_13165 [Nostoc sp.]|uniref:hypothetical protein n=1 Tax=Nostoc sp. TaxID=1180 RepID=UPI002FF5B97D
MTTVAILPTKDASGEKSYRAMSDDKPLCVYAGDKHSVGKTAGQALDALTARLGETEFSAQQQERLSELMRLWRSARDRGQELLPEQQAQVDDLVEAELKAATAPTAALMQPENFSKQNVHL